MSAIKEIEKKAENLNTRIFFPEAEDDRILPAVAIALKKKYTRPVLIGNPEKIKKRAKDLKVNLEGIEIIEPYQSDEFSEYVSFYSKKRNIDLNEAKAAVKDPLVFSAIATAVGDAEAMIAGAVYTSADVMTTSYRLIGLAPNTKTYSSFFIMDIPGFKGGEKGSLVYADCGVNPNPDSERLADIAVLTGESVKKILNWKPRIAMLSFSTKGSASEKIPEVAKVIEAVKLAKKRAKGIEIDGEIQADAALVPDIAARKIKEPSSVAGKANILIFPNLDSGNICYKMTQIFTKAEACGPILQGFAKPVSDLSRGATVEDVVGVIAIMAVMVKNQ